MSIILFLALVVFLVVLAILILVLRACLVVVGHREVLILSGERRRAGDGHMTGYRLIRGGRALRRPLLERVDRLALEELHLEMELEQVRSSDLVPLTITLEARVRVCDQEPLVNRAVELLLNLDRATLELMVRKTIEGILRAVAATQKAAHLNQDQEAFSAHVVEEAESLLERLGLQVDSCTILSISDGVGYLESLTNSRVARIRLEAREKQERIEEEARSRIASLRGEGSSEPPQGQKTDAQPSGDLLEELRRDRLDPEGLTRALRRDPGALEQVILGLSDFTLKDRIRSALLAMGPLAVPALVEALSDDGIPFDVRPLLEKMGEEIHGPLLEELGKTRDEKVIEGVLAVLHTTGCTQGGEILEELSHHTSFSISHQARELLRNRSS